MAPGTAMKYIFPAARLFSRLKTCKALQVDLASLTEVQLADILITMSLSRSTSQASSSCSSVIKALRWLVKSAEVGCLQAVSSVLIGTFLNQKIPRDRKRAPPLPLWTLVQWERRILISNCTLVEVILLGTFLIMAWGFLRFSDAQRSDLQKIIYHDDTMRGVIWRSKTAVSGMPLAIAAEGFLSKGSHSWLWKFLTVLDSVLDRSGLPEVDFLLPLVDDHGPVYPLTPMDYATELFYLRKFLGCPWRQRPDPLQHLKLNFTLHSLKATLLSWGPQLHEKVTPEQRLSQGHHSDPNSSLETYSRDVVWTSLTYQRKMIQEVQGGWRPAIAQHRGSQAPMVEPIVVLEKFVKLSNRLISDGFDSMLQLRRHLQSFWTHQTAVPRAPRSRHRMMRFQSLGPRLPKLTLGPLMWTKSWWDDIVQLFMHWCEPEMMKIGVLDGRDSLSNQHVAGKCVEWRPRSWIDSTLLCPFASMQRAGKFGILANSCKDLDRS